MSNRLSFDKQVTIIAALAEGASIRGVSRMLDVDKETIMQLGKRVGDACAVYLDERMRNLSCKRLEVDELWAFINKKQAECLPEDFMQGYGDAYTFVALDAETKLVPAFLVGRRDYQSTNLFIGDLSSRLRHRIQLSTDGFHSYAPAVEATWGVGIDYAQIVKSFASPESAEQRKYSPSDVAGVEKTIIVGSPDESKISTSFVEKQNHTVRMHCRRFARLTNGFSKKLENFKAAVALHFAYYNLVKFHSTIRCTPAMAAGVERSPLTVKDLVFFSYQ
ncbi:MAG TPA: IS1 family transposase [Opitutales bacterium]|jgi:IS1 family transposase|nr:IS1 family transposase [Opitutales bacterium]